MNKTYLFILCILFLKITQGQRTSGNLKSYTVKGSLIDQETLQPLEYGTISLVNKNNPKRIQGGITDSSGVFNIQLPAGTYDFKAEFIGFVPFTIKNLMISETKDFGQIGLKISQNLLNEIELIAEKTEVEIRLDKRIYNVGKDLTVRGGNVADVLGNVPSVSVDLEGNVSLRGNDNVRILINGKPSGLVGISGPQGLQNLPAESIEKVEVITSPSARYGAEGTAGIINVVLRKDNLNGLNGNFVANGGIPERYSGSLNVNYRTKKVNVFSTNSILNNLNIQTSYNLAADSLALSPLRMNGGTQLFKNKMNINFGATLDPYALNENNVRINEFQISNGGGLFRLTSANLTFNYAFSSSSLDKDSSKNGSSVDESVRNGGRDDDLFGKAMDTSSEDFSKNDDTKDEKPSKLYNYKIPWTLRLAYAVNYNNSAGQNDISSHSLMFSSDVELSPKWSAGVSSGYDFKNQGITYTQLRFERDLLSWRMNFSWIPFSANKSWNFFIGIKSGMLSDIKYDKRRQRDKIL